MQSILFIGIPATGKSTFYRQQFFYTHVRINLDMLRTRHRESILFEACLRARQPHVIDNTNVTRDQRRRYIEAAQAAGFTVTGYYFQSIMQDAIQRNRQRSGDQRIPDAAIYGIAGNLELPAYDEGFERLYYVMMTGDGSFEIQQWQEES